MPAYDSRTPAAIRTSIRQQATLSDGPEGPLQGRGRLAIHTKIRAIQAARAAKAHESAAIREWRIAPRISGVQPASSPDRRSSSERREHLDG